MRSLTLPFLLLLPSFAIGQSSSSNEKIDRKTLAVAEYYFQRFDQNGDGLLDFNEMQKSNIRLQKNAFDRNRDGVIDRSEYSGFYKSYKTGQQLDRQEKKETKSTTRSKPKTDAEKTLEKAQYYFKKFDRNRDGRLNADEMEKSKIRFEKDKFDTDRDGTITKEEYVAFYEVHSARSSAKRSGKKGESQKESFEELDRKPTVYYSEKLPDHLPAWFKELDTNTDGQVTLYEWRDGQRSTSVFQTYDHNDDAFITPREVLETLKLPQGNSDKSSSSGKSYRRR